MRTWMATIGTLLLVANVLTGGRSQMPVGAQGFSVVMECGASSATQVRTTLYFGLARPKESVSELEWPIFLRDEVTRRFPDGLTVWEAEGQWRTPTGSIDREQSKVLLLVHPDTAAARQSVQSVIEAYRRADSLSALQTGMQGYGLSPPTDAAPLCSIADQPDDPAGSCRIHGGLQRRS